MMGGACGTYGEKRNAYRIVVGKHEKEENNSKELSVDGRITIKWILRKYGNAWIGLIWLNTRTDRCWCMRKGTYGFLEMQGIS